MPIIRRVVRVAVFSLGLLFIVIAAIASSDQACLKVLQGTVRYFSNYRINVKGNFNIIRSSSPVISTNALQIIDTRNDDQANVARFYLQFDLKQLFSGTLLIKQLEINTVEVSLAPQPPPDQSYDLSILKYLPAPVIQDAAITKIVVFDRQRQKHILDKLTLSSDNELKPLEITATGKALEQPFQLQGTLGRINDMFNPDLAFPIHLQGSWRQIRLLIDGDIKHMAGLSGIDLKIDLAIPDLDEVFDNEAMQDVQVKIKSRVTGNYDLPTLSDIDFKLTKADLIKLNASGRIIDLLTLTEAEIRVSGVITDPALFENFTPDFIPLFEKLQFKAVLSALGHEMLLQNIDAHFTTQNGLSLELDGSMHVDQTDRWLKKLNLNANLNAPDTAPLNQMLGNIFPEMGASRGQATFRDAPDGLIIDNLNLIAGHGQDVTLAAAGAIKINLRGSEKGAVDPNLQLQLQSKDLADLLALFDIQHPRIGPVSGTAELYNKQKKLVLGAIQVQAGSSHLADFSLKGGINWDRQAGFRQFNDLRFYGNSPSIKNILQLYGIEVPALGPIAVDFHIQGFDQSLIGKTLRITIGSEDALLITISGGAKKLLLQEWAFSDVNLTGKATAAGTQYLAPLLRLDDFPDLGALISEFKLNGSIKDLGLSDFMLSVRNNQNLSINITGNIKQLPMQVGQNFSGVNMKVSALMPSLADASRQFGYNFSEWGKTQFQANLHDFNGYYALDNINFFSQQVASDLNITGKITNLFSNQSRQLSLLVKGKKITDIFAKDVEPAELRIKGSTTYQNRLGAFKGAIGFGNSNVKADLSLSLHNDVPKISGNLVSQQVFISDFKWIDPAAPPKPGQSGVPNKLFSQEKLDFDWLNQFDIDVWLRADKLSGKDHHINGVELRLNLADGRLRLFPAKFFLSEGSVDIHLDMNAKAPYEVKLKTVGEGIKLGPFLKEFEKPPALQGNLDLVIDVQSQGLSEAEIMSKLQGQIGLALENGKIKKRELEIIFLNLIGWLFSYGISENEVTISCGMINFNVQQGIANTGLFVLDGPKLLVRGDGIIDLKKETIDYKVNLEKKKMLTNNRVPIQIKGKLSDPVIKQSRLSAFSSLDRYVLSPVVEVPSELLGTLWGVVDNPNEIQSPCQKLVSD